MSEEFKQTTADDVPPPISHTRILWIMAIVLFIATIASLIFATWHVTAGVIIGGILSFVNYYWLKFALYSVFEKAVEGKPKFLVGKYILRYFAIGAVIVLIYLIKVISVAAVIGGLLTFAAAILIESFILVVIHISKRKEI